MITSNAAPCWVLRDPANPTELVDFDSYGESHFTSADAARDYAKQLGDDPLAAMSPVLLDAPCWTVTCVSCGYVHDEEDEGIGHFASADEAAEVVKSFDWQITDHGPACLAHEECATAYAALAPVVSAESETR